MVHGIGLPPLVHYGSTALKQAVIPAVLAGNKHISLAITEPSGGSDVARLTTTAKRDGDVYVVNGSKTFITGGMRANWVSTAGRSSGLIWLRWFLPEETPHRPVCRVVKVDEVRR